jgi:enoyl-CoA hydratase/carnithine racemase
VSEAAAVPDAGKVTVERRDALAVVVLDQRERRNAISVSMWHGLERACREVAADPAVRCVIVRGAGEEAFVSGADISQFGAVRASARDERAFGDVSGRAMGALLAVEVPVIALIHGYCFGGGVALSLGCDLRYASDDALFAIPAARLGLGYGLAAVQALIDVVGPSAAKEILFTARRYGAADAQALGLVNRVFPKAELDAAVEEIALAIAANAPLTIRAVKRAAREALRDESRRDAGAIERMVAACFDSSDYREGVRAFLEKRSPRFEGR